MDEGAGVAGEGADVGAGPRNNVIPQVVAVDTPPPPQQQQQNQFGAVRDRLFHAMLVRMALSYTRHVPRTARRLIEFSTLLMAISLLGIMMYVHMMFGKADNTCLAHLTDTWPRDGVLRVEVINNLDMFNAYQDKLADEWQQRQAENNSSTPFDLKRILMEGPSALPKQLRSKPRNQARRRTDHWSSFLSPDETLLNLFLKPEWNAKKRMTMAEHRAENGETYDYDDESLIEEGETEATFEYVVEYSLYYGLLRLPHAYRLDHNIPFQVVRLDPEKERCFGDWLSRGMMKYVIGYEDVLMASVKALAENETDKGYLRDMITGEHYRFVTMGSAKASYLTALFVMLIFTFAISMLLRFSHHQIFLFIVDLLQMFELNQALVFPAAPLLTVILALVGMEAIMSEVFNDTSTAFYVILLVWIADQYDAICCHSPISKRHWLRFFYLYHYAFYAYQYRYNGQYGVLALLASTFFILHSMIFFFHHYELPLILYHERLQRIIGDLQHNPVANQQVGAPVVTETVQRPQTQTDHLQRMHSADVELQRVSSTAATSGTIPQRVSGDLELNLLASADGNGSATVPAERHSSAPEERHSYHSSMAGEDDRLSSSTSAAERRGSAEGESSGTANAGSRQDSVSSSSSNSPVIDDPLLMAGERTARDIVESAMSDLFES